MLSYNERQKKKPLANSYNTVINMVDINPNISKMTLSVNGLYTSIKSQRLPEWIKKNNTQLYVICKQLTLDIKTQIG